MTEEKENPWKKPKNERLTVGVDLATGPDRSVWINPETKLPEELVINPSKVTLLRKGKEPLRDFEAIAEMKELESFTHYTLNTSLCSLEEFLKHNPGIKREQVTCVTEWPQGDQGV